MPESRVRLERAALDLFIERGFEGATACEIAARAGLTERTFFRHFADKREVLFGGQAELQERLADAVRVAPAAAPPLDVVACAFQQIAREVIEERRPLSRKRQTVINAVESLRERELLKLAALSQTVAVALQSRGVAQPLASLTAESGMTIFKVAYDVWIEPSNEREFAEIIGEMLEQLKSVISAS